MRDIKIRYIVRHKASGNIEVKHYYLNQIEQRPLKELSPAFLADYETLSRDLFTGLKDKNGKEVYEGDIIKHRYHNEPQEILWDERILGYKLLPSECLIQKVDEERELFETIGNQYEHPHLLEESK